MQNKPVRFYWGAVCALLAAMVTLQFTSARRESQTVDEGHQLISGYIYLVSGRFDVGIEHPPLLKLLWAVPVWFLHPDPPRAGEEWAAAADFLYRNRVGADAMLQAGRYSAIAVSALLGLAIAYWGRRLFGDWAGLFAVFLYAADPNFLANGRYMKNDVGAALGILAGVMVWGAYLMKPARWRLAASGVALGLALSIKNSATILWVLLPLLYVANGWRQGEPFRVWPFARRIGAVAAIAFGVIFCVYGFEVGRAGAAPEWAGRLPELLRGAPVPAMTYFRGLVDLDKRVFGSGLGVSFLLGKQSPTGWWYTTPVALAVKTPLGELLLFTLALWTVRRRWGAPGLKGLDFRWYLLAIPTVCYLAAAMQSHSNSGERHLLPVYPFLFLGSAGVLLGPSVSKRRAIAVGCAGVLLAVETATIQPHYLAFFNALAGGPEGGRRFLVDSNLDWGQDLKNLKAYLDERGIAEPCLAYYGWAPPRYYGIRARPMPPVPEIMSAMGADCVAAISVTKLGTESAMYGGLYNVEPDARIGYSIYVYDLRRQGK